MEPARQPGKHVTLQGYDQREEILRLTRQVDVPVDDFTRFFDRVVGKRGKARSDACRNRRGAP